MKNKYTVLILDMQPIDPPIGGGRLRVLGLYHNLGDKLSTQYVGSYDWPGEKFRDHYLSETLREVDIPLSDKHFAESRKLQERVGGKTVIDSTFHTYSYLSPQYVEYVRKEVLQADVVIFSHPWVYPLVKDLLNKQNQTIIYDSQNVEGFLRFTLLDDAGLGTEIVKEVVMIEAELCHFVDIILACSNEDRTLFNKLYDVPIEKIKIVPNGGFTEKMKPVNLEEKKELKNQLGLVGDKTAIFIGSNYGPNIEACEFIIQELAPKLPDVTFIIAGGIGDRYDANLLPMNTNIKITGVLTDQERFLYLAASDIAINPMFSGSGTNIKMFDFMAVGIPVITTNIGARGIAETDYAGIVLSDRTMFLSSISEIINNPKKVQYLGKANRDLLEQHYSWEKISPKLGDLLSQLIKRKFSGSITPANKLQNKNKLALMSSWNIRCGIAEHSRNLIDSMELNNIDLRIIGNSNTDLQNTNFIDDLTRNVYPFWYYDYTQWRDTKIDTDGIINLLHKEGISKFNIQYHLGFFPQPVLLDFVRKCTNAKIDVILTVHNSKEMFFETFKELSRINVKIIVHTLADKIQLTNQGIKNVYYVPLGILEFPDEDADGCKKHFGITGAPVIGSFGFLRPHKGVLEAIESISLLRAQYPKIQLLGINSLYPSDDSAEYLRKCNERINELNLQDNVTLITDFLNINQIIKYLHTTDLIVMPYHDSKEGSSAAANTVIASKRPLIISNSGIFNEIKNVGYELENITPALISSEINKVLEDNQLINQLKNKVTDYVHENSYLEVANKYLEIINAEF